MVAFYFLFSCEKKMSKITLSLTISSHYGQNSKIAKCLFIDDDQPTYIWQRPCKEMTF